MKFLDDLRAYLERPEPPQPAFVPDMAAHRRHLLDALVKLEKQGKPQKAIAELHDPWNDRRLKEFVLDMARSLCSGLGRGLPTEEIEALINIAIDWELGLDSSTGSYAKDLELERATEHADNVLMYALELRAVKTIDGVRATTPIGKLILELPDQDTLRWLLAVEVVQATGVTDTWRLSREGASALLKDPEWWGKWDDAEPWPTSWEVLHRLDQMGIVKKADKRRGTTCELLPRGRRLLEEIASGNDTPFILLARAMLQDETTSLLGQSPAGALVRQENAAAVATRHARMVAHEIRNALVPLQVRLSGLYEEIERRGLADVLAGDRERMDVSVDRIFGFVQNLSEIADLAAAPAELFNLQPAVEAAIAAARPELGHDVVFTREGDLAPVMGHRERFVLALVNVLRNAAQARQDPPVRIQVTAGANNGAEVFVRVDDDGPGVAEADRTNVFSPGFSRRRGGSGLGLAFVREVVEAEMAGRVAYEESPLGGARFVIRLPVGTRRSV